MNKFEIAHFSLFVIDAWKYTLKAIIFIHATFIHNIEVFPNIFNQEITNHQSINIPLILYFSHIFTFNTVLIRDNIMDDFFFK